MSFAHYMRDEYVPAICHSVVYHLSFLYFNLPLRLALKFRGRLVGVGNGIWMDGTQKGTYTREAM